MDRLSRRLGQVWRGVFALTMRMIQAISTAAMMMRAMPAAVSMERSSIPPGRAERPNGPSIMGRGSPKIKNAAVAPGGAERAW